MERAYQVAVVIIAIIAIEALAKAIINSKRVLVAGDENQRRDLHYAMWYELIKTAILVVVVTVLVCVYWNDQGGLW